MNCPVCKSVNLVMAERQGIEIDYCPQCRGVWLDRGELDKIIERSLSVSSGQRVDSGSPSHGAASDYSADYKGAHQGGYYKKKKREGFLSDLFDF